MTLYELTRIIKTDEEITFVVIAEDGREFELETVYGGYFENLNNETYWVDTDYSCTMDADGHETLDSYDILLTLDELQDKEVIELDLDSIFHTIKLR